MEIPMTMPDLATTDSEIKVTRWLVAVGQPVRRGQPLLEIETDKAVMEVESFATGMLKAVRAQPEDTVEVGQVIALLEVAEATAPVLEPTAGRRPSPVLEPAAGQRPSPTWEPTAGRRPSEAAEQPASFFARNRQRAAANGNARLQPGPGRPAEVAVQRPAPTLSAARRPEADPPSERQPGPGRPAGVAVQRPAPTLPAAGRPEAAPPSLAPLRLTPAQRTMARRMQQSKQTIPHFYLLTSANAEPLLARRAAARPERPLWDAFFVQAAARALRRFDRLATRFAEGRLVPQPADVVGLAVDVDGDLCVVPITGAADRPVAEVSQEIRALVAQVRAGDAAARALRAAALTVTNLGSENIETFLAIINPPEAAILALGRVAPAAVVQDGQVIAQQRVSLSLSVDHRVVSGKYAARFLSAIVAELEAPGTPSASLDPTDRPESPSRGRLPPSRPEVGQRPTLPACPPAPDDPSTLQP